ncbi:hypothetical protein Lal_00025148 [Lupinus albus]|uniref:Uncharacterized protein n=1 Tax=Lupinus albus TaxID=3870 RepID=A0A6A5NXW5_LUPAL|nr:hypothetical protein Lalb_Chr10g0097901 [Lupinus albus]KAF1889819.1 hypothetical protein Lal_00025148 [Lupinus albus]
MSATASSDVSDGPVLNLINKRLRALRKKLNRITYTEESLSQGKQINKEQEEVLRSKPSVLSLIDELEKLRQPLQTALAEELNLALTRNNTIPRTETHSGSTEPGNENKPKDDVVVEDILNLLYFGSLFDVKSQSDFASTMLTRTHERGCCLTYDYVTDDATDLLREKDLDLIAAMRGLLISRPADSSLSHKNALQRCIEHAKLWLARAEEPIEANADVTYAGLRERLSKIMSSEYFTTTPEMKATVEVAAAAAAGNYYPVEVEVEGSVSPSQEKVEGTGDFQGHGSGDDQFDPEGEHQKGEVEAESAVEVVSVEHEQTVPLVDVEHNQQDIEAKEQQHYPRRGYQNQRGGRGGGGGRRGYSNGRGGRGGRSGGRGYQNGHNQYHDQQPGNYYPRNYHNNRGRGGGRGGGYSYDNHGPGGQVNYVASNEVQS